VRWVSAGFLCGEHVRAHVTCASLVGIASGGVRARGLGKSQGREHVAVDTMEGCPGRGRASLNQRRGRGPGFEGERSACLTARRASWWREDGIAHTGAPGATATLRGRDGSGGSSSRALVHRGMVRRVGTYGAELHSAERASSTCGSAAFALRPHEAVASREACDRRSAPGSGRLKRATVNRHAPFDSSLRRANGWRRTRDSGTRYGGARARTSRLIARGRAV